MSSGTVHPGKADNPAVNMFVQSMEHESLLMLVFLHCVQDGRSALSYAPLVLIRAICTLTPTDYFTAMLGIRIGGRVEREGLSSGFPLLPPFRNVLTECCLTILTCQRCTFLCAYMALTSYLQPFIFTGR
jgi:hypothetical protein